MYNGSDDDALDRLYEASIKHGYDSLCYISQKGKLQKEDISDIYYQNPKLEANQTAHRVSLLKLFRSVKLFSILVETFGLQNGGLVQSRRKS